MDLFFQSHFHTTLYIDLIAEHPHNPECKAAVYMKVVGKYFDVGYFGNTSIAHN